MQGTVPYMKIVSLGEDPTAIIGGKTYLVDQAALAAGKGVKDCPPGNIVWVNPLPGAIGGVYRPDRQIPAMQRVLGQNDPIACSYNRTHIPFVMPGSVAVSDSQLVEVCKKAATNGITSPAMKFQGEVVYFGDPSDLALIQNRREVPAQLYVTEIAHGLYEVSGLQDTRLADELNGLGWQNVQPGNSELVDLLDDSEDPLAAIAVESVEIDFPEGPLEVDGSGMIVLGNTQDDLDD